LDDPTPGELYRSLRHGSASRIDS